MDGNAPAPRHGHRTPAEIAEDEVLSALRGEAPDVMSQVRVLPERCKRVTVPDSRSEGRKEDR